MTWVIEEVRVAKRRSVPPCTQCHRTIDDEPYTRTAISGGKGYPMTIIIWCSDCQKPK